MIFMKDNMRYERVLSKNYEFHYKDMKEYLQQFLEEVKALGVHPSGPLFYALNNVPRDERMKVEFFIPVKEEVDTKGKMKFHSYYSVENMMSMRILNDFEEKTGEAYSAMTKFMNASEMNQITPPYHIIDRAGEYQFVTLKIGYMKKG